MALIICPECKKEISDKAEVCIHCGYPIHEYIDSKEIIENAETESTFEWVPMEDSAPKYLMPVKPNFPIIPCALGAVMVIIGIVMGNLILIMAGLLIGSIPLFGFSKEQADYELANEDFDAYQIKKEQDRIDLNKKLAEQEKIKQEQEMEKQRKLDALPACPICGSKANVKRLTTLNRSASIAVVGLASGKIGKQYECTKCKHMW